MRALSRHLHRYEERLTYGAHRGLVWYPTVFFVLLAAGATIHSVRARPAWSVYVGLGPAVAALAVVWGLWRAREWARWSAGLMMAALVLTEVVFLVIERDGWRLPGFVLCALMTANLFHPETKRNFAAVRAYRADPTADESDRGASRRR